MPAPVAETFEAKPSDISVYSDRPAPGSTLVDPMTLVGPESFIAALRQAFDKAGLDYTPSRPERRHGIFHEKSRALLVQKAELEKVLAANPDLDAQYKRDSVMHISTDMMMGARTNEISDKWQKATPIETSPEIQAISDAKSGGPVEVRYSPRSKEVMVLFTQSGNEALFDDVAAKVGERSAEGLLKTLFGGDLVVHMHAQTYVDQLGGEYNLGNRAYRIRAQ